MAGLVRLYMADSTVTASSSQKKRGRGATMMRKLTKVHQSGQLLSVTFDPKTWNPTGAHAKTFKSYLSYLARSSCSILKDEWKDVDINEKDKMLSDLQSYFVVPVIHKDPDKDPLRNALLSYAGDRWRGFKTQLTREYVSNPKEDREPPYVRYSFIKEGIWKQFLASRHTPEFKEKSQKGKEKVANNVHPHRLSRGGYDLLMETMMAEKRSRDSGDRTPSPPPRYEGWKRARQKPDGSYTSTATKVVADKIDSLVEETEKGSFVPMGRDDILTAALGTAEHGGQVRGVGRGATITNYFGRALRSSPYTDVTEQLSQLETKIRAEFEEKMVVERQMMQKAMLDTLKSAGFSQNASPTKQQVDNCSPIDIAGNFDSMKASCSVAPANMKEDLDNDTDSVQKLLCMIVKRKTYLPIQLEHDKFVTNFKMSPKYMKDLLVGDRWLDYSILQLWCTYMHRLSLDTKNSDLFAFLDPCQLSFASKPVSFQKAVKQYIQNQLRDLNKVCYLAPHLWDGHWQLIIMCPKDNVIVCLCSLHHKIPEAAKSVFTK
ncbi:unnamed protein product [Trifolium pratense]|uniref:Uncharacterized protein n=1 Tax=Trifolium pratense TaxID=57577 RepID=A0ACB0KYS5_TRIPR|nr:unnamed protein product [Trifolium pratense]